MSNLDAIEEVEARGSLMGPAHEEYADSFVPDNGYKPDATPYNPRVFGQFVTGPNKSHEDFGTTFFYFTREEVFRGIVCLECPKLKRRRYIKNYSEDPSWIYLRIADRLNIAKDEAMELVAQFHFTLNGIRMLDLWGLAVAYFYAKSL